MQLLVVFCLFILFTCKANGEETILAAINATGEDETQVSEYPDFDEMNSPLDVDDLEDMNADVSIDPKELAEMLQEVEETDNEMNREPTELFNITDDNSDSEEFMKLHREMVEEEGLMEEHSFLEEEEEEQQQKEEKEEKDEEVEYLGGDATDDESVLASFNETMDLANNTVQADHYPDYDEMNAPVLDPLAEDMNTQVMDNVDSKEMVEMSEELNTKETDEDYTEMNEVDSNENSANTDIPEGEIEDSESFISLHEYMANGLEFEDTEDVSEDVNLENVTEVKEKKYVHNVVEYSKEERVKLTEELKDFQI